MESRERGPDPGDLALLQWANKESRIVVTIDMDFGQLIFLHNVAHSGLIRLPDVPSRGRQKILDDLLSRFAEQLEEAAIITVRNGRIRISKRPE